VSHRVRELWMGEEVETLADLIPREARVMCVGINPAPVSVAAGHYYQGTLGQRFFGRLRQADLLPAHVQGWEDDAAMELGVGFTDVVKRPTASADQVRPGELAHGRALLIAKLEAAGAPLAIFSFKKAATTVLGKFEGNGFVRGLRLGHSEVFVMPGPMEARQTAHEAIETLRQHLASSG
jgi:TDG/mug DNA glycosylase family protein